MKTILAIAGILVAVFVLFMLAVPSQVKVLTHEEAKAACFSYCDMGCKLNDTIEEMKKIWGIVVVDEKLGRITCGNLVGNCICT